MSGFYPLLNEESANLLIDQLKSTFNAQLQIVDNMYSDGISLEPLKSESIYISEKFEPVRLPAAFVLFGNFTPEYSKEPNYLEGKNEVVIVISAEDMGADALTKKMWRYARVAFSSFNLVDLQTSDGRLKIRCVPKRIGYSDKVTTKMSQEKKKYRQDCVIELDVLHYEKNLTE